MAVGKPPAAIPIEPSMESEKEAAMGAFSPCLAITALAVALSATLAHGQSPAPASPVTRDAAPFDAGTGWFGNETIAPRKRSAGASADTTASTPTPLLNEVTRSELGQEARARARRHTPRVIGIAPRTDADRTDEMPDDPIIRY